MTGPSGVRARRATGWVPSQHGAWAMLVVPLLVGLVWSGPRLVHLPLTATWLAGYLAFHAAGRWVKARSPGGRRRERTPVLVYAAVTAVPGLGVLALDPALVRWVPVFVPLLVVSLVLTARGAERSLTNDVVTVLAAGLMTPVAYDAGGGTDWAALWLTAATVTAYLLGTVPYVKTMIRERGRAGYVAGSVGAHVAGTVVAAWLAVQGLQPATLPVLWAALTVRAWVGPAVTTRRATPLRPAVVGAVEIVASLAVLAVAVQAAPGAG